MREKWSKGHHRVKYYVEIEDVDSIAYKGEKLVPLRITVEYRWEDNPNVVQLSFEIIAIKPKADGSSSRPIVIRDTEMSSLPPWVQYIVGKASPKVQVQK